MKYFTPELIAAANNWVEQSKEEWNQAHERFWATVEEYYGELERLKPRVSRPAWDFFRYSYAHTGLHDATLLSLSVGDVPGYTDGGTFPPSSDRRKASARVEFLNYERDLHHVFDLRGLSRVRGDLFVEEDEWNRQFGDLFTYELTEFSADDLQLGFIFSSGASVVLQFKRLVYRRRRVKSQE